MSTANSQKSRKHPAKFSQQLMPALAGSLVGCKTVLDPFAGTGRIHELNGMQVDTAENSLRGRSAAYVITLELETYGVELEPEWAEMHQRTAQGDALHLPFTDASFDAICTSPTYGNRMADHHEARDDSTRNTYRHQLGRPLTAGNSGSLQWGDEYRAFHEKAWKEALRVLRPGGRFVLNIKDHIRGGEVMPVTQWHCDTLQRLGLLLAVKKEIKTPGNRLGANGDKRVDHEWVIVFFKPDSRLSADLQTALNASHLEEFNDE